MLNDAGNVAPKVTSTPSGREAEALRALNAMYEDGVVCRAEAEQLFLLQTKLTDADTQWQARFNEAIRDYVLSVETPSNWVTAEEAAWLIDRISVTERPDSWVMVDLLIDITRKADGVDISLVNFLQDKLAQHCIADGVIGAAEVERIRAALYAASSAGGVWITEQEADLLFALNDATAHADNHPSWNDLFARMIANYVTSMSHSTTACEHAAMARDRWLDDSEINVKRVVSNTFGLVGKNFWGKLLYDARRERQGRFEQRLQAANDAERITPIESAYVNSKINEDGFVSPAEQALLNFLHAASPEFKAS